MPKLIITCQTPYDAFNLGRFSANFLDFVKEKHRELGTIELEVKY